MPLAVLHLAKYIKGVAIIKKISVDTVIALALVALLFLAVGAMVLQHWLDMPTDVVDFLKASVALPVLVALLTAWKSRTGGYQDPP